LPLASNENADANAEDVLIAASKQNPRLRSLSGCVQADNGENLRGRRAQWISGHLAVGTIKYCDA